MAIKSDPFGRIELTGDDATRFIDRMRNAPPTEEQKTTLARCAKMSEKFRKNGRPLDIRFDSKTGRYVSG